MSIFSVGLRNKGYRPVVEFWFDNQVWVGVPKKGVYIFYDRNQLCADDKYSDIQNSVDNNTNFVDDYKRKSKEIFDNLFAKCAQIDRAYLTDLDQKKLYQLFKEFFEAMTVGPIITVQLWAIEALWDEEYKIAKFLRKQSKSDKEFKEYKEILSINIGETVAFTEQKDFYKAADFLDKAEVISLFKNNSIEAASKKLFDFKKENSRLEKHINEYEWMNKEYVSGGWSREKWLELFKKALLDEVRPIERLHDIENNFHALNKKRAELIKKLNPPADVRHALDALAAFIAERDWSKGWFAKSLLSFNKLLIETAKRMKIDYPDIFNFSYEEIFDYFEKGRVPASTELKNRSQHGFVYIVKHGQAELITGETNIEKIIQKEEISDPFDKIKEIREFRGLAASSGKITGRARVLEDADKISEFEPGEILVTYMTTMEFTPIFRKAAAVITDEGGMSCHAAIVSREFKLPCIVGTKVATRAIKTGDMVEVDAEKGIVRKL